VLIDEVQGDKNSDLMAFLLAPSIRNSALTHPTFVTLLLVNELSDLIVGKNRDSILK